MRRFSFVDEMAAASEFDGGDVVRKTGLRNFVLSPYVGRVLYSSPKTGKVMVQWPWGPEQESPVELVKDVSATRQQLLRDESFDTWEKCFSLNRSASVISLSQRIARSHALARAIVAAYEHKTLPLWRAACKAWHSGTDEVRAYMLLSASHGEEFGDEAVRNTISNLYEHGRRLSIYWKDKQRKYKVTQKEHATGRYQCARCRGIMTPRTYTHGQRVLMCKTCGFTIHPSDLIAPGKSPGIVQDAPLDDLLPHTS